ncbi:MAG: M64 family metallopeptidase [Sphingomonadaceae bacterium]
MTIADGNVLGITKIVDAGTPATRWNLVLVSDGYQAAQMAQFATDAQAVADRLVTMPPFDRPEIACGINVYRLDVTSTDAGADKPDCDDGGGSNSFVDTYFDATFCAGGDTQRALAGNSALVQDTVEDWLPEWHQILVIVNDPERGGTGGSVGWTSNSSSDWREVAIHEIGHSAFGLADEYDYGGPDDFPGGEPAEPNVTIESNPASVKWSAHVTAGPDNPTRANPDCTTTDPGPSPVAAAIVGTFEGAKYSHCGAYRPVWNCMMRDTGAAFCPVCTQTILDELAPFAQPAPSGDVTLATSTVDFNDVPTGLTVVRAARFDVHSCVGVTFQAITMPTAPFALESPAVVVASPAGPAPWPGYFWFRMTAGAVGPVASQMVTLRCLETAEDFVVTLTGNVINRPTVATQLVFDKSGSMLGTTDEGRTKEQVLKDAATVFADLMWDDNGVGINAYDEDPHPIMDVQVAGAPGSGGGRDDALAAIGAHASNPNGWTAIGDGVELAKQKLDAAPGAWDHKAMIVLTDGIETRPKYISEVADSVINNKVFAIGMGTAEQIQPSALNALTNGTGGYLLMTGNLSTDETFLLEKYYIQILAGVNNNDLVLDPEGWARAGVIERIPFDVTDSDVEITGMVIGRPAWYLIMALEAPDGSTVALGNPSLIGRTTPRTLYMRAGLPLLAGGASAHAGRWHLLLTIHPEFWKRLSSTGAAGGLPGPGIRYSASVSAWSNLRMAAAVHQNSYQPGAILTPRVLLTEYGAPFKGHAVVRAELTRPDATKSLLLLPAVAGEPGAFQKTLTATQSGIYRFRFLASGRTVHDQPFTRETTRTAAVWHGGDNPGGGGNGGDGGRPDWCAWLECLFGHGVLSDELIKRLQEYGINIERLRACLGRLCQEPQGPILTVAARDRLVALLDELAASRPIR